VLVPSGAVFAGSVTSQLVTPAAVTLPSDKVTARVWVANKMVSCGPCADSLGLHAVLLKSDNRAVGPMNIRPAESAERRRSPVGSIRSVAATRARVISR
jgi:hypothetical protein